MKKLPTVADSRERRMDDVKVRGAYAGNWEAPWTWLPYRELVSAWLRMVIGRRLKKSNSLRGKFVGPQTGFGQLNDLRSDKSGCFIRGRRETKLCTHRVVGRAHVLNETGFERNSGALMHVPLLFCRREHTNRSQPRATHNVIIRDREGLFAVGLR
jgi:hypothetical protein